MTLSSTSEPGRNSIRTTILKLPSGLIILLAEIGRVVAFAGRTMRTLATSIPAAGEVVKQCVEIGIQSLPIVIAVSIFIGLTMAVDGYFTFRQLGGENMLAVFAGMTLVRELCPAIAAGVITAKAGTRIAASIGLMRIKEQIDALEVMAVDPFQFLIAPRVLASVIMVPFLILVSDAIALVSTFALSTLHYGLDPGLFIDYVARYVGMGDVFSGMVKGAVFGFLISVISCYFGYRAARGPEGVGRATNRAVVITGMVVILVNLILTELLYGR